MIRLPAEEACYIAHSIDDAVKPADLREALELVRKCLIYSSVHLRTSQKAHQTNSHFCVLLLISQLLEQMEDLKQLQLK